MREGDTPSRGAGGKRVKPGLTHSKKKGKVEDPADLDVVNVQKGPKRGQSSPG